MSTGPEVTPHRSGLAPSDWLLRWLPAWQQACGSVRVPGGPGVPARPEVPPADAAQAVPPGAGQRLTALDVGCGGGRHLRLLAAAGVQVTGVDRDAQALAALRGLPGAELIQADIEAGPWPLEGRQFDLVLVTNYLWRPLLDRIKGSVAPGGWLIYETFTDGQQTIGRPARPEFLLRPGELLSVCSGLRIVAFEDGFFEAPASQNAPEAAGTPARRAAGDGVTPPPVNGRYVQRVAAVRETSTAPGAPVQPPRYPLNAR